MLHNQLVKTRLEMPKVTVHVKHKAAGITPVNTYSVPIHCKT